MTPQLRYWNSLYELIFHGYLLQAHCQAAGATDRKVKAILAITSSTSLGIWAVFKAYPLLWAGIIVVTQIITATSKYLPYTSRLKAAGACTHDFREIQNWAESKWCEIIDGELTDIQINKARSELQSKTARALKLHFPLDGLPSHDDFNVIATEQSQLYLSTHYGVINGNE
jgi:hypothetical protein